jgi:hypothetical protein
VFEWLSDNRATIALFMIIILVVSFIWSIIVGRRQTELRAKDEVFGDPERTKGGWYWAVCGVSALLLYGSIIHGAPRARFSQMQLMSYVRSPKLMSQWHQSAPRFLLVHAI